MTSTCVALDACNADKHQGRYLQPDAVPFAAELCHTAVLYHCCSCHSRCVITLTIVGIAVFYESLAVQLLYNGTCQIDPCIQARKKLADSRVATSAADKQRKQLDEKVEGLQTEVKALKIQSSETQDKHEEKVEQLQAEIKAHETQRSEAQRSHEEELQGLRQTMHMAVEQLRSSQTAYEAKLARVASDLTASQAEADQHAEDLARQLGQSDFALRQLKSQAEQLPNQEQSEAPEGHLDAAAQRLQRAESEVESLTQELDALKAQLTLAQDEQLKTADAAAAEHAELRGSIEALESQSKAANLQQQQLTHDSAALQSSLESQVATAETEKAKLREQVAELQLQVETHQAQADSSQSRLQSQLAAVQAELASSQKQQQELLEQVTNAVCPRSLAQSSV